MNRDMDQTRLLAWLRENDPARLEALWRLADDTRRAGVGNAVHLRGLIEISNHCVRQCAYCGLRAGNRALARYRMNETEIVAAARQACALGYGTVVLQAGEDTGLEGPRRAPDQD
jgi:biotin synthase